MRRMIPLVVGGAAALGLGGCSADAKDFQEQGQKFLEGDEVRERFGMVRMSEAQCAEPANTEKDTQYTCTATGSDGNTWQFTIEIAGSKALRVIQGEVVGSGTAAGSADPAGSAPGDATTPAVPTTATGASTTAAPTTAARTTAAAPTTGAPAAATAQPTTTTAAG